MSSTGLIEVRNLQTVNMEGSELFSRQSDVGTLIHDSCVAFTFGGVKTTRPNVIGNNISIVPRGEGGGRRRKVVRVLGAAGPLIASYWAY